MFNLILNSPLSDVLAPALSSHEEFLAQYEAFVQFFVTNKNEPSNDRLAKLRIEQTHLADRLAKIVDIVLEEQEQHTSEKGNETGCSLSPSMEYLLQNNLFETLSILAQGDTPLGIYPKILTFFIRLLLGSTVPLLPHRIVYTSLNKLLAICGKTPASPYETNEILFLHYLTDLVSTKHRDDGIISCFITDTNCSRSSFPLINSLLSFLTSADAQVAKRAGESLLKLVPLINKDADRVICEKTAFCSIIISLMIDHYGNIPRSLKADQVELAIASYRALDEVKDGGAANRSMVNNSVRKFLSFLRWYKFFDMLLCSLPSGLQLQNCLLKQFQCDFLVTCILPDMLGEGFENDIDAIDNIFLTTVLMSNCLRNTESQSLFDHISHYLLIPEGSENTFSNHRLCQLMLSRCDLKNFTEKNEPVDEKHMKLASVVLQLLEDILVRPSKLLIDYLIMQYIEHRNYIGTSVEDTGEEANFSTPVSVDQFQQVATQLTGLPNISKADPFPLESIDRIVYLYRSLVPKELKLEDEQVDRLDLQAYLQEAIKGFQLFMVNCYSNWNMDERHQSRPVDDNLEAPFVSILFDNLDRMLTLPYETNLQVCCPCTIDYSVDNIFPMQQICSLLAKISLIPDKCLNEYLLDPTVSLHPNLGRSLFSILHQLIGRLQIEVKGIDNLQSKLTLTKRQLLGDPSANFDGQQQSPRTCQILKCCIVLDEFCKELCAIILAKHNIVRLCKP